MTDGNLEAERGPRASEELCADEDLAAVAETALIEPHGQLRGGRDQFRALIEHTSDIVAILDPDGRFLDLNPAVERVLGFHPEELLGASGLGFIHPEDLAMVRQAFIRAIQQPGARPPIEHRVRHKDGSWRVLEMIANNQLADPAITGVIVTARDITNRRRTDDELISNQGRYRELFENANDIIYTHDL